MGKTKACMDKVTDDWTIGQVFVNSKVFFFPKQGENYLQLKTSLTLNQAFVTSCVNNFF